MQTQFIWIFLFISSILSISGCNPGKTISSPQSLSETSPKNTALEESQLPATYFYLESRIHTQNNEIAQAVISLKKAIKKDPDSVFLKRELIRLYLKEKHNDQALILAQNLVDQNPENIDNLLILARLIPPPDQKKQLPGILKKILTLDPKNKETYLRLGNIYMENQNSQKALNLFSKMTKELPDYYVAYFYLGEANLLTNNLGAAKKAFLKTIELEPKLVESRFELIEIYKKLKKKNWKKQVLKSYKKILEIEPENNRAALEMALFQYKNNAKTKALVLFTELGNKGKEDSQLLMAAVDTYIAEKRYQDAIIVFSQLLKAEPDNSNLNFFAGMAYEATGNIKTAIEHYLKVTPEHPQYKETLLSIAFLYRDIGQPRQAIKILEQHHKNDPKDVDIISFLASFYEDQTQYNKAITILNDGLKTAPDNLTLLFRLGTIQDKAGLKDQSIQTMKTLLQTDPDNANALNYLGYTYAEMGINLDQALELISRAMKQKPNDGYITDSLGWVYYQKQNYTKAIHYLELAAQLSDFETIIADHLADAYLKSGQLVKALITYKKAVGNAKKEDKNLTIKLKEKILNLEKKLNEK
ncbi:MAG: tetratricopeptide repeat protein [Desulfobacteraceae bacterium]|nr:tetratricopeptide repeat protein [Desulfobacteraceae bacterium]